MCLLLTPSLCRGTVYCKPHFLALFRERGTYNFSSENGDPTAPAFGCKRQPSADSSPSSTSQAAAEKIVKKPVVKPNDNLEEATSNPYDHIRLKPTSSSGPSLSRWSSSDTASSNPYDHVQLKPTGVSSLSPSQSSSSDNFSQQESEPTPIVQQSEEDPKAGSDHNDEDEQTGKSLAGHDMSKTFPTIISSNSETSVENLINAIRGGKNNDVKEAISGQGVELLLEKGVDGKTPIEFAFASENVECGRFLIDVLQSEIQNLKTV